MAYNIFRFKYLPYSVLMSVHLRVLIVTEMTFLPTIRVLVSRCIHLMVGRGY